MLGSSNCCAIHIFASLAGGTGSGGIVDLVTMIRKEYPNASTDTGFPIFLYLYVTDRQFEEAQVGYFHGNQAAVLRDLNALASGQYKPNVLGGANNGQIFTGAQPITQIVLSSHLNGKNQLLSIDQQHQIFAEAAFERIYCFTTGNLGTDEQKALTGEDKIGSYSGEPAKIPLRSYRFGSSGMRRWEVPIDEVRELLASELLKSSLNTLLYQNWSSTMGAADERLRTSIQGYLVTSEEILTSISAEKISQSKFSDLVAKLNDEINRFHDGKRREGFKDLDLDDYEKGLRERYTQHLDGKGIKDVFGEISNMRGQRIERIKSNIHQILKRAWTRSSEPLGLVYISDLLIDIQSKLRKEIDNLKKSANGDAAILNRINLRKVEWTKLTFLSRTFKQSELARAHQADVLSLLKQDLRCQTEEEDAQFLESITRELGQMAADYKLTADFLTGKCERATNRSKLLFQDLNLLKSEDINSQDRRLANKAEFSVNEIKSYISHQSIEKDYLINACNDLISNGIDEVLGGDELTKLGRLSEARKTKFDEITEGIIFRHTSIIHDAIVEKHHHAPVLTGNILDILEKRFNDDPTSFRSELKAFIDSSASSILLSSTEIQPRSMRSDSEMPSMPRQVLVIGVPSVHPFGGQIKEIVKPLIDAGSITYHSVYMHDDPTQIRMLTMTYWMAARYARVVHGLEAIYNTSLAADREGDKRYFTNIDPSGEKGGNRPAILLPTAEESQSQVRAALWLGCRLLAPGTQQKLIQEGDEGVVLLELSKEGLPAPFETRSSFEDLYRNTDITKASRIITAVEAAITNLDASSRDALLLEIKEHDAKVLKNSGSAGSAEYIAWKNDRDNLFNFLSK
jgi:hypothetical protein